MYYMETKNKGKPTTPFPALFSPALSHNMLSVRDEMGVCDAVSILSISRRVLDIALICMTEKIKARNDKSLRAGY